MASVTPVCMSTGIFLILSGVFSATSSISTAEVHLLVVVLGRPVVRHLTDCRPRHQDGVSRQERKARRKKSPKKLRYSLLKKSNCCKCSRTALKTQLTSFLKNTRKPNYSSANNFNNRDYVVYNF